MKLYQILIIMLLCNINNRIYISTTFVVQKRVLAFLSYGIIREKEVGQNEGQIKTYY